MTDLIGVYGAGGCGRGILPLVRQQASDVRLVFIDDGMAPGSINGHDIVSWNEFLDLETSDRRVCLAISSSRVRETLALRCDDEGIALFEARAANVVQMDAVVLGGGACLSPFVTLTSNIRIGRCFHANLYSYVEHDCVIGDFVTFAPGVKCNGNVVIEDHVYIGAGAVLKQGGPGNPLVIGRGAVVGMGAVVTKSVAPGVTVVGNPARVVEKRNA